MIIIRPFHLKKVQSVQTTTIGIVLSCFAGIGCFMLVYFLPRSLLEGPMVDMGEDSCWYQISNKLQLLLLAFISGLDMRKILCKLKTFFVQNSEFFQNSEPIESPEIIYVPVLATTSICHIRILNIRLESAHRQSEIVHYHFKLPYFHLINTSAQFNWPVLMG